MEVLIWNNKINVVNLTTTIDENDQLQYDFSSIDVVIERIKRFDWLMPDWCVVCYSAATEHEYNGWNFYL